MKIKKTLASLALAGATVLGGGDKAKAENIPFFEDKVVVERQITDDWVYGGAKRGTHPSTPIGAGNWTYSHNEITTPENEKYLEMRVQGPNSGNTFGAEAWIRTAYDYNDGNNWDLNFTWKANLGDGHYNHYLIQITDGYIPNPENLHWSMNKIDGTINLFGVFLYEATYNYNGPSLESKNNWSIIINPNGIARLYGGPDATGSLMHEGTLDPDKPWYVRFMVSDGTSAGSPAGNISFDFYDFETNSTIPEPSTLGLLALGSLVGAGYLGLRKKKQK